MSRPEIDELVRDCLRYAKGMALPRPLPTEPGELENWMKLVAQEPEIDQAAEDAWFEVYNLVADCREDAWEVLKALARRAETDDELGSIGAGILESFVRLNGSVYVDEIELEMASNPKFVVAMQMVNPICVTRHPELDQRISNMLGI